MILIVLAAPLAMAGANDELYSGFADATGYHTQPKMARAADGAFYMTYVVPDLPGPGPGPGPGPENATDVVVLRDGVELPRVKGARGDLARPSLALDAHGTLFLAWTERADEDREVFAARFVDGQWRDITKLSGGEGYAGFPSLAASTDGHVHVAWYGFDGDFYQTFYREWDGAAWLPAEQLSSGPLDANNPSLAVDESGAVHVAWYKDEGRRYSVWYARRAPEGAWELPRRLPQGEGDALNVALAIDAAQRVHVAWDERTDDGTFVMHSLLGEPPTTLGEGEYAAIAPWHDRGWLAVWAAPNGTLMAADITGTYPLFGGVQGRHPSLRGAGPVDRDSTLDILWAVEEDGEYEIVHRAVGHGCAVDRGTECAPARARMPAPSAIAALAVLLACLLRPGHNR